MQILKKNWGKIGEKLSDFYPKQTRSHDPSVPLPLLRAAPRKNFNPDKVPFHMQLPRAPL